MAVPAALGRGTEPAEICSYVAAATRSLAARTPRGRGVGRHPAGLPAARRRVAAAAPRDPCPALDPGIRDRLLLFPDGSDAAPQPVRRRDRGGRPGGHAPAT